MPNHPQLLFVAGPNGAGKSTFSKMLSSPGADIFDVDKVIARIVAQTPAMPKKQVYKQSTQKFFDQAADAIRRKTNFTLETNFRDIGLADVVAEFKQYGYTTSMVYLTLESIEQSLSRVNERVKSGGHFVDKENIQQNFDLGLQYLEELADRFDNLEIIDTSTENRKPRSLLSVQTQKLVYLSNSIPDRVAATVKAIAGQFPPLSPGQGRGPRR